MAIENLINNTEVTVDKDESTDLEIENKVIECKNYKDVFNTKPGLINNYEYELELIDEKPFFVRQYPIPLKRKKKLMNT